MKQKKSLIDKMRTQLKKEEKKKEQGNRVATGSFTALEIQKNKNVIVFENDTENTPQIPKI